ncbi:hypothetical protein H4Q26_018379 [Puccinia striiformis f. sp. tritici PST-130]|nr:hypothetical protein H4Q26_014299 [Puccinia striiformis f. sp. tritici PST-130]KAI9628044.1 hypothetical protein H4Q26_018229 [Puccinia striiformis f. sp. tritici PST-130]KAI9628965.1 hypothetical protein H4Q26_018379 [Puccinia striiformis f. sp. tritici PST-130]
MGSILQRLSSAEPDTPSSEEDSEVVPDAPKLEATKPQQDGTPLNQTAKTLAHRIADPKVEVIRKLASRITDALAADISNVGTNEDEAGA